MIDDSKERERIDWDREREKEEYDKRGNSYLYHNGHTMWQGVNIIWQSTLREFLISSSPSISLAVKQTWTRVDYTLST